MGRKKGEKLMKNKLMIDIETIGQAPGCRVLSFAAFGFSKTGEQVQIYKRLNADEQISHGLTDDVETLEWWSKQDAEIRKDTFSGKESVESAIADFKTFFYKNFSTFYGQGFQVWCCGADFDFAILRKLFEVYGFKLPWKYYSQCDYRTLKTLFPEIKEAEKNGCAHSALLDAMAQMRGLRAFFEKYPEAMQ
jgi:hypothetical protein